MAARSRARGVAVLLGGIVLGVLLVAAFAWIYFRTARFDAAELLIEQRLNLPPEAVGLEEISPDGSVRIALRDVAVLDLDGDTILAAPVLRARFNPSALGEGAPIRFSDVELRQPFLRVVRQPDGTLNLTEAVRMTAAGRDVEMEDEDGRSLLLRDVRITDGRVLLATPWQPDTAAGAEVPDEVRLARIEGTLMRLRTIRGLDARLPRVRVGGVAGWRVTVASLDARLVNPDVEIIQLSGEAEQTADGGIRFVLDEFRTERSLLEGAGIIRFAEAGGEAPSFDFTLRAQPLALGDLRWLVPALPAEGEVRLALNAEADADGRTALTVSNLEVALPESRLTGNLTVLFGGGAPPAFRDTRIAAEPLDLGAAAGFAALDDLPIAGQIRGTLTTADTVVGAEEGALRLDLTARLQPRDTVGTVEPVDSSIVGVVGTIAFSDGEEIAVGFDDLRLTFAPLQLELLAPLASGQRDRLRGTVRGSAVLAGTPDDLRLDAGELTYEAGTAAPTRIADLAGSITTDPELRYALRGRVEPLALGGLGRLFPALPFRQAQLTGPFEVSGSDDALRFDIDLSGREGAIAAEGSLALGDVPAVDVSGRVQAFRPEAVFLRPDTLPVTGPLSGTFAARGPLDDLRFNVDLTQGAGTFVLEGRIRRPDGAPRVEVAGRVADFRLGAVLGRPGLFGSSVTGEISLTGGGRAAYVFDLDVRGEAGVVDIEGWYAAGDVPEYALSGTIAGLDLAELVAGEGALPHTRVNLTVDLEGQGTTPETLNSELDLVARGTTSEDLPVDVVIRDLVVRDGIIDLDYALASLAESRLTAVGTFGLTRPAPGTMDYTLVAPNLGLLAPILASIRGIEPRLEGSLSLNGWLAGSLEAPVIAAAGRGDDLRYEGRRVGSVTLDGRASQTAAGWSGRGSARVGDIILAGGRSFDVVRLEADAGPESVGIGIFVQRDDAADLAASGTLTLDEGELRAVSLQRFTLRLGQGNWQLAAPTRFAWSDTAGLEVDSLVLRRAEDEPAGLIAVDGRLPRTGIADFTVRAVGVDLGNLAYVVQPAPQINGVVALAATVQGPVSDPDVVLRLRMDNPRFRGGQADTLFLVARYAGGRMQAEAAVWTEGAQAVDAGASIPLAFSLEDLNPEVNLRDTRPMDARLVADSLPLSLLAALIPQVRDGQGIADGQIVIGGTPEQPVLTGSAIVAEGAFTIDPFGVRYRDIDARLTLENDLIRIESLSAQSIGTASLSGTIRLDDPDRAEVSLTASLDDFLPIDREEVSTVHASGRLALSGRMPNPVLTGSLVLSDGTLTLPGIGEDEPLEIANVEVGEIGADTIPEGAADQGLLDNIRIEELEVVLGEGVWIELEDDARVQIDGELLVYRTGDDLRIYGDLAAERGAYTLEIGPLTREFEVVSGRVQFFGTSDFNPSLDITAAYRVQTAVGAPVSVLNILVELTGTIQSPRIQLTSDTRPPLPESDLLSYLIFGRPGFARGGVGGGLAQQLLVQELAGNVLLSPIEQALLGAGIFDYVRFTGRPTEIVGLSPAALGSTFGSTAIEGGRELFSDELFFTVECTFGGLVADARVGTLCGVGLDWQIDRQWSAGVSYEPLRQDLRLLPYLNFGEGILYQFSTQIRRRWEYGRPGNPPDPAPQNPEPGLPGETAAPTPPDPPVRDGSEPESNVGP